QEVRGVEGQVGAKLVSELVPGAAGAGAERVPALDHETGNHSVEDRPVVELVLRGAPGPRVGPLAGALRQLDEVANRLGRLVGEEPQDYVTLIVPPGLSDR